MQREFLLLLAISALGKALPRNEVNNGSNNGAIENLKEFAPRFKRPSKMYNMDMKVAGSSFRLKCAAEGNPVPNITWFKNNGPVDDRYFKPTYGKWSIVLDELSKTDNGNYTCLVCNGLGCISHTVNLIVIDRYPSKPNMTKGPENQIIAVGQTASFRCEFQADLEYLVDWKFYKTYEELQNRTRTNQFYEGVTKTSDDPHDKPEILTIANVTQEDQGWYTCVAMNTLGTSAGAGYLTVLKPDNQTKSIIFQTIFTAITFPLFNKPIFSHLPVYN